MALRIELKVITKYLVILFFYEFSLLFPVHQVTVSGFG